MWTGFGSYIKPDDNFVPGKTLWDWMDLLIIPVFLGTGLFLLNRSEKKTELEIAADRQRETALQSYFDRMAQLLLEKNLLTNESEDVRNVARIQTLTILRAMDNQRIRFVLHFLLEAGLINNEKAIVSLDGADLSGLDLSSEKLQGANFSGVNFQDANFFDAKLQNANFSGANLSRANLSFANLSSTNIRGAYLNKASLYIATLNGTILQDADLSEVNLNRALGVIFADFTGANLFDAIMPDGRRYKEQNR